MAEYKFVTFAQPADTVFDLTRVPGLRTLHVHWDAFDDAFVEQMMGWEAVSFQVVPLGETVHLIVLFKLDVSIPDVAPD